MNKKALLGSLLGAIAVGAAWFGWLAYRAHRNLVTLNVRNMELREVIKKIERQTWETIIVDKDAEGKVTLDVRRMPLEDVLTIIDDQVSARWNVFYPLYTTSKSLALFKRAVGDEIPPPVTGWTNLNSRGFRGGFGGPGGPGGPFGRGGFGGFGGPGGPFGGGGPDEPGRGQNTMVSLQFKGKDLAFAMLALGRYAQARIVPEDGTTATVSLSLERAPVTTAIAYLAKQAHRKWAKIYVLQGFGRRDRGPDEMASRDGEGRRGEGRRGEDRERRGPDWAEMTPERRQELRQERETLNEQLKEALPPAERQKMDQARQQREQQMQEFQNLTPEQRRERFAQMGGANREQRQLSRIRNSTPEQRVERYRQIDERRQRWQQQGGRGRGRN